MTTQPAIRVLSLGAGVQSTTMLLLAAEGRLPRLDAAIFADTGWEPRAVYDHLDRLDREVAQPAGIPLLRVKPSTSKRRPTGNLRQDSLTPGSFVRMPVFVRDRTGGREAIVRRQCTEDYKLVPLKATVRDLLGYPHPRNVPRAVYAEQLVGFSRDEAGRANGRTGVRYLRTVFPLLEVGMAVGLVGADGRPGWTRADCVRYLTRHGWGDTPKSACIGCPFHGNAQWRNLRDHHPAEWADAVDFDRQLRTVKLRGIREQPYLHRSLLPLDQAPIDRVTANEHAARQGDLLDAIADQELEQDMTGCSPWACPTPVQLDAGGS